MGQPINPYVAGAPLRGERGFFGRQDTLEWVGRELRNPATNALVLFGQRRIGKTTLLLQLQRTLPADTFLPVYFDLQDQATRPLGRVLADLADTVAERTDLEPPDPKAFDDQGRFFIREFVSHLYHALGESRRPVFLLDEFDVLDRAAEAELSETAAAKALFPFLRRVMTEDPRLAFSFVVGRRAEDLSLDFTATFKASLVREIWVLDQESAEALVRQAEANSTLCFTEGAVARILSLTSCHPYLTQLLCQRVWERAYARNPSALPRIDTPEVEAALPDALEAGDQALIWVWNGLSPAEKIYAAALTETADEGETIPEDRVIQVLTAHAARLRTREVELAPRDLVKRRVLEQVGEREYRFAVELFRHWLRQHKPLRDVKDELDQVSPLAEQLFSVGQGFFRVRQWQTAIRYFRDALETYPNHFRARLHLGEALLELGQLDEAVAELERAYELDRDEARLPLARVLVTQAKAREEAGDEDGALTACEQALQISPNERVAQEMRTAIWTRRGDTALKKDDLETALAAYREVGEAEKIAQVEVLQQQRALETLGAQAQAHEQAEAWAEAAAVYEQLVTQAPDKKSRTAWKAELERCRKEEELARLFNEGVGALEQENWKQAERAFAEVVHCRPDYERGGQLAVRLLERGIWTQRGDTALEHDDLETALAAYKKAGDDEKIGRVETLRRRQALAELEAEAQAHERAKRWANAAGVYEQLLLLPRVNKKKRATWHAALERCQEEEKPPRLFGDAEEVKKAASFLGWLRSQASAWVLVIILVLGLAGGGWWALTHFQATPTATPTATSTPTMTPPSTPTYTPTLPTSTPTRPRLLTPIRLPTPITIPIPQKQPTPIGLPTPTLWVMTLAPVYTPTPEPAAISTFVWENDGSVMVYVPAGEFLMGASDSDPHAVFDEEKPQHTVYLDAFHIDKTEVTNAQYRKCVEAGVCSPPHETSQYNDPNRVDHPVAYVDWNQASTYCKWAGKRLPTEAEWEKAARGTDGRFYSWGNEIATCEYAIMAEWSSESGGRPGCGKGNESWPVGSRPKGASPYGALDMAGNVYEWVADWYAEDYYANSPRNNPTGPDSGQNRVLRSGSFVAPMRVMRASFRRGRDAEPSSWHLDVGFRCAK